MPRIEKIEKVDDAKGTIINLFKNLDRWRYLLIISIILALVAAMLSTIAPNRLAGIRASHCTDTFTARMTRMHNDSNILCLGERITGVGLAKDIVDIWLNTDFEGGRHQKRIDMI